MGSRLEFVLNFLKLPGPSLSAGPDVASFRTESDTEARDREESPPSSPVFQEVNEPPQLPVDGMIAALH